MISVPEALRVVLQEGQPLPPERVALLDSWGRVLAEDVAAHRDLPPRDNSAKDGYALRHADLGGLAPGLEVVDAVAAGSLEPRCLGPGQAMKIMTGAVIPEGADTVVPVEDASSAGSRLQVARTPLRGDNIRPAGEDVRRGDLVLSRGAVLRPVELGMLASLGRPTVAVHQRPRVAVLATGDEIVELGEPAVGDRIINSNSYGVAAQVLEAGGVPVLLGIGRDDPAALQAMLARAGAADVVLTTGGVSVGDYDYVRAALEGAGVTLHFWRVAMKPGGPATYGTRGRVAVFGLPGNPVSAMVAFEQFVRPLLRLMQGHRSVHRPVFTARLAAPLTPGRARTGRFDFIRCRVERAGEELVVTSVKRQGSGLLKTLVEANALLVLDEGSGGAQPGDRVPVQIYDPGFLGGEAAFSPLLGQS